MTHYLQIIRLLFMVGFLCSSFANIVMADNCALDEQIADLGALYERMIEPIETVPPDIENYLHTELTKAIKDTNKGRFMLVSNNPYYHSFDVRNKYAEVKSSIDSSARDKKAREKANDLTDALARLPAFLSAYDAYIEFDEKRPTEVLSKSAKKNLYLDQAVAPIQTARALKCAIANIE